MTDKQLGGRTNHGSDRPYASSRNRELQVGLPGELRDEAALIETAVSDLNRIHTHCALDFCLQVGEYVLDTFFDGQGNHFARRARRHRSFRSMANSGQLTFSSTYLWTSVAVASQYRQLPPTVAAALPLSHHRVLLTVNDPALKRQLADRALQDSLSRTELSEVVGVHKKNEGRAGPGRPRHPAVFKHLTRLDEALQALLEIPEPDLEVDVRFRDRVQGLVDRVKEDLRILEDRLESVVEGIDRDKSTA